MEAVSNIQELIHVIGVNRPSPSTGSRVIGIKTWDNRIVRGSIYKGSKRADIISIVTFKIDSNLLWSHVKSLLENEKSFIIRIGPSCDARFFEWTISDN